MSAASAQDYGAPASTPQQATGQNAPVAGGRSLRVLVAQSEIKSDINLSNVAVATGGGLLGGLIGAAVDSARAKKAEQLIVPVRSAMADVDADAMAIEAAKASFANAAWNVPVDGGNFSKDSSPAGKSAFLDSNPNAQTAFVEYTYDLSPNFDALRVVQKIEIAAESVPSVKDKPEKRLAPKYLVYSGSLASVVLLPSSTNEKEANAALWAADGAKLARAAMAQSFARLQQLTPRLLAMTSSEQAALTADKKNKRTMAGGFLGRPQPTSDGTTLLWTGNGFVDVAPLN
ncbi:MAG: hypothetical protein V4696_02725 [Pseudomonadota bacterium]